MSRWACKRLWSWQEGRDQGLQLQWLCEQQMQGEVRTASWKGSPDFLVQVLG